MWGMTIDGPGKTLVWEDMCLGITIKLGYGRAGRVKKDGGKRYPRPRFIAGCIREKERVEPKQGWKTFEYFRITYMKFDGTSWRKG